VHFISAVSARTLRAKFSHPSRRNLLQGLCRILVAFAGLLTPALAHARPSAADCLPRGCGYGLSLELGERFATRKDFTHPVFLFQHPVDEVRAHELELELELWFELLFGLGLEFRLPLVTRSVAVRYAPVLISLEQRTPATWRQISATGLADPSVLLDYRLFERTWFEASAALGVRIPEDDNPKSGLVPERMPLGTGQRAWFFEAELAARLEPVSFELAYQLAYHPGDAASYLVRQIGSNQIASGVLGDYWSHELALEVGIAKRSRIWFSLTPSLKVEENPLIVQEGREFAFLTERTRVELGVRARFGVRLSPAQELEAFAESPLTHAWQRDPFFPIVLPARGFGLAFRVWGP
jgi:hypothetical protein